LAKARELGVKVLNEAELRERIEGGMRGSGEPEPETATGHSEAAAASENAETR